MPDIWSYPESVRDKDLAGFSVEALDGSIGKIDEATTEVGSSYLIVDTGPWIFGKKVMIPAGVIDRVDVDDQKVFVNRNKDEVKDAPEYDPDREIEDLYRDRLGEYYSRTGTYGQS